MSASTAQKSAVVPSSGWKFSSVGCGQSAALMSQNRHSCGLGTLLVGLPSGSRRINAARFCMNLSLTASGGMRIVWSS